MEKSTKALRDGQFLTFRRKLHLALFVDNPRHSPSLYANHIVNVAIVVSLSSLLLEHTIPLDESATPRRWRG